VFPIDIEFLEGVDKDVKESGEGEGEGEKKVDENGEAVEEVPEYPHRMTLLRPELIELYFEHNFAKYVAEKKALLEKEEAEKKAENGDKEVVKEETEKPLTPEETFDLRFNPDAFALPTALPGVGGENPEGAERVEQQDKVRALSKFVGTCVANAAYDLVSYPSMIPLDGQKLTNFFHGRGLNMRYLGKLLTLLDDLKTDITISLGFIKSLLKEEMIARAAKIVLRELLREVPLYMVSQCISHFFNCLFADPAADGPVAPSRDGIAKIIPGAEGPFAFESLTAKSLDERLRREVYSRFRYPGKKLPVRLAGERKLPLLRSICLKVGIQILNRERVWESATGAFVPEDILNIYPIVKHPEAKSSFGDEVSDHSIYYLRQGQRDLAIELIAETASIYEQVYGPVHPDTGRSYRSLAMIKHETGDLDACRSYQRKAVIVTERTLGFDDPETIQQYINLGFFECLAGNVEVGLGYMRYALRSLEMLCAGGLHPEIAAADTQIAMMLMQGKRDIPLAAKFHSRAANAYDTILGRDSDTTARAYEHLCQCLLLMGDFRSALDAQRIVFRHVKNKAGDEETPELKEATVTLEFLTQRAVIDAKKNTAIESSAGHGPGHGHAHPHAHPHPHGHTHKSGKKPSSSSGKASHAAVAAGPVRSGLSASSARNVNATGSGSTDASRPNKGHLSVDELLKFIEAGGSQGKKKKKSGKPAVGGN
ncbi:Intracellular distribution of mitochondria, partial [Blyttiomyces sp. JEL0837]